MLAKIQEFFNLGSVYAIALFSTWFALIRMLYDPKRRNLKNYFISVFVSLPVGVFCGLLAQELGLSNSLAYMSASLASLLAHDFILFCLGFANYLKSNDQDAYKHIYKRIFGDEKEK